MKKVMFVVVMMLFATACFAQLQSPPSNLVGYVKVNALANGFTPFGLPFQFWNVGPGGIPQFGIESTDPSDIVGDQTTCAAVQALADLIWRQDNGFISFRNCSNVWQGDIETNHAMLPGRAYWYRNRTAADRALVLAGQVNNAGSYGTVTMNEGSFNPYSWRDSRNVDRSQLNLLTSGFLGGVSSGLSDQVWEQGGAGNIFWYRTSDGSWQGLLVTVDPGRAYWVQNRNHANDSWNYDYVPGGALLVNDGKTPASKDNGASISKVNSGKTKVAPAGTSK